MISLTLISFAHDDLERLIQTRPMSQSGAGLSRGLALLAAVVAFAAASAAVLIVG